MSYYTTAETPIDAKLLKENFQNATNEYWYQQLFGWLMYFTVLTRSDLAYSVSSLSQYSNSNNWTHWKDTKRVLNYFKNTRNYGIVFRKNNLSVEGYVDAVWDSDISIAISFECRKQRNVALSRIEPEHFSLSEECKESIYLKNLLFEILKSYPPSEITGYGYKVTVCGRNYK